MFLRTEYCNTNMKELDRRRRGKARHTASSNSQAKGQKIRIELTGKVYYLCQSSYHFSGVITTITPFSILTVIIGRYVL